MICFLSGIVDLILQSQSCTRQGRMISCDAAAHVRTTPLEGSLPMGLCGDSFSAWTQRFFGRQTLI